MAFNSDRAVTSGGDSGRTSAETGVWLLAEMEAGLPAKAKGRVLAEGNLPVARSPGRCPIQCDGGG